MKQKRKQIMKGSKTQNRTHREKLHGEGVGDFGMGAERNWRPRRDALLYGRAFPG